MALAYGAVSRKIDRAPRDDAAFWLKKLDLKPGYDVIIAGDSRMNRGVAPEILSPALGGLTVTNFAFSGGAFEPLYFDALTNLAVPRKSTLILGVTPRSLTELASKTSGYVTWAKTTSPERANLSAMHSADLFFTPENPVLLIGRVVGHGPKYGQEMHEGGWLPGSRIPEDPKASLKEYAETFKKVKVSPKILHELAVQVKRWTLAGVNVVCIRPPTTADIVALEDNESGYSETEVKKAVVHAGGAWIDIPQDKYPTYDGNHLTKSGAIEFTKDLATALLSNGIEKSK